MTATAFETSVRIYYEDTDAAGIVYYANYLKFFERARTELLRAFGVEQRALTQESGVVFAVRRIEVDYLKPARLDDVVTVDASVASVGGASLSMTQRARRTSSGRDGTLGEEVLATASVRIACLDAAGRPTRLPEALRARLRTEAS